MQLFYLCVQLRFLLELLYVLFRIILLLVLLILVCYGLEILVARFYVLLQLLVLLEYAVHVCVGISVVVCVHDFETRKLASLLVFLLYACLLASALLNLLQKPFIVRA